ncbi:MAG: RNA 2',3'-cyclic phosphodiesterase [Candidatus Dormibacteraeota bacterium]|nr:RNA 2',3'-cyclic phosphodiesterase [Candidatus Dormibacteraeota bacterium]
MAISVPESVRESLAGYLKLCSAVAPEHRWVRPESLHLTLRFLGQIPEELVASLAAQLGQIPIRPFQVALGALGTFGGRAPRVTWLSLEQGGDGIRELAAAVESRCITSGALSEGVARPGTPHPHLTLGRSRARYGSALPAMPEPPALPGWTVDSFALYRSRLGREGAEYTVLETFRS